MPELATPAKYNLPNIRQNLPDSPFLRFGPIPKMPEDTRALGAAQINATGREKEAALQAQTIQTITGVLAKLPQAIQDQHQKGVEWGYKRRALDQRAAVETKKLAILNDPDLNKDYDINYDAGGGISMKKRDTLDDAYRSSQILRNLRGPSSAQTGEGSLESDFEGEGMATVFGLDQNGKYDKEDNGLTAAGMNSRDPSLKGVSFPEEVLKAKFGSTKAAFGKLVEITNPATGKTVRVPIIEVGPAKWTGNAMDLTYGTMKDLGGTGKDRMQWKLLGDSEVSETPGAAQGEPPVRRPLGNIGKTASGVYVSPLLGTGKSIYEKDGKKWTGPSAESDPVADSKVTDKDLIKAGLRPDLYPREIWPSVLANHYAAEAKIKSEVAAGKLTEQQAKAMQYSGQMKFNREAIDGLIRDGFDPTSAGGGVQNLKLFPNVAKSAQAQQFMAAKLNWIESILRYKSGATIQPHEYDAADKQYFPQYGDDPKTVAQKKALRETEEANMSIVGKVKPADTMTDIGRINAEDAAAKKAAPAQPVSSAGSSTSEPFHKDAPISYDAAEAAAGAAPGYYRVTRNGKIATVKLPL